MGVLICVSADGRRIRACLLKFRGLRDSDCLKNALLACKKGSAENVGRPGESQERFWNVL